MPQYRTIWILRGDLSVEDARGLTRTPEEDYALLLESYKRHSGALDTKRYNLGLRKEATSKKAALYLIKDPGTAGVAWHSHADHAGGIWAAGRARITPEDIKKSGVSPNLAFVALLGCLVGLNKKEWVAAFGLDRFGDGKLRLAASSNKVSLYGEAHPVPGRGRISGWAKDFAENGASSAQRMLNYNFPDWVDMLPPVPQR